MPRPFTLEEITNLLKTYNIIEVTALVLQPPKNVFISDEDSGGEEGGTIHNLPKSLMSEPAYLVQYGDEGDTDDFLYASRDDFSGARLLTLANQSKGTNLVDRKWEKADLTTVKPVSGNAIEDPVDFFNKPRAPAEIFGLLLNYEITDLIVKSSNAYAQERGVTLDLSHSELRCFLGVIFMSGYVKLPKRHMLWEQRRDVHNALVSSVLAYDRFETIFSNLYVADRSNLDVSDKFAKLRPLINKLNERFLKFVPHDTHYNFDEILVPYYGRHEYGRSIEGQRIRFGYKFWCGATPKGYICWFQPYQDDKHKKYDVNKSPIIEFCETLTETHPGQYHFVISVYTSLPILDKLNSMGHQATGRLSRNGAEKAPLESSIILQTKDVGKFDYRKDDKGIIVCRWNDNRVITVASSGAGIAPMIPVSTFSEIQSKTVQIQQPNIITVYNRFKEGVSTADKNIDKYRASIRGKKWYSSPLLFCFELILQNAWQLHKVYANDPLDLLEFRRSVANHFLDPLTTEFDLR